MLRQLQFLIIILYHDRPKLLKLAYESVLAASRGNVTVTVIDDGSTHRADVTLPEADVRHTQRTVQQKIDFGYNYGKIFNELIESSDADYVIGMGDDNLMHPNYLDGLAEYLQEFPCDMAYSNVILYDPLNPHEVEKALRGETFNLLGHTNKINRTISFHQNLDTTQYVVSRKFLLDSELKVAELHKSPLYIDHDFTLRCLAKAKRIYFTGLIAQYRGTQADRLTSNAEASHGSMSKAVAAFAEIMAI